MPWWIHSVLGLAVVGAVLVAAGRGARALGAADGAPRLLGTAVLAWLLVQAAGLATLLPVPGALGLRGALAALLLAALLVLAVRRGSPEAAGGAERGDATRRPPATTGLRAGLGVTVALLLVGLPLGAPVGLDGLLYHLALPAAWIADGHLAALTPVAPGLPVEAYPVGAEVATGWLLAVTGSWAATTALGPLGLLVLVVAVHRLARTAGAGPTAAAGAAATVGLGAAVLTGATTAGTDLPAAALLAAGAALALGDRPRPALAIAGVALAVGVKTPAVVPGAVVLAALALGARPWGRPPRLAAVVAHAGLGLGGAWLARNLVLHGWPLWPLQAAPWGDPVPPAFAAAQARFLDDPVGLLRAHGGGYLRLVAPLVVAVPLAVVALARRGPLLRPARVLAAAGLLGLAAWTVAPATGLRGPELAPGATRYLVPSVALLVAVGWTELERLAGARLAAAAAVAAPVALAAVLVDLRADAPPIQAVPVRIAGDAAVLAVLVGLLVAVGAAVRRRRRAPDGPPGRAGRTAGAPGGAGRPEDAATARGAAPDGRPAPADGAGRGAGPTRRRGRLAAPAAGPVLAVVVLLATPGFWSAHARTVDSGTLVAGLAGADGPLAGRAPVVVVAGFPPWATGPYARARPVRTTVVAAACREAARGAIVVVPLRTAGAPCPGPGRVAAGGGYLGRLPGAR